MIKKIILITGMFILLVSTMSAIKNPAAVYCGDMGYEYNIVSSEEGDVGMCEFSDGTSVNAWDFLKGKVAQEKSYCVMNNYEIKTIQDSEKCSVISSAECAVCIKDGTEIEVTELMNLDFSEGICGDGICLTLEENYNSCPEDCLEIEAASPSGEDELESLCVYDGICLEECIGTDDVDCLCIEPESEECKEVMANEFYSETSSCIPSYECVAKPAECPSDGVQTETCVDTLCGTKTLKRDIICEPGECSGCIMLEKCYPFAYRKLGRYCSDNYEFVIQFEDGASCENNYECESNFCTSGKCFNLEEEIEKQGTFRKVVSRVLCKILNPFSDDNYNQCVYDYFGE